MIIGAGGVTGRAIVLGTDARLRTANVLVFSSIATGKANAIQGAVAPFFMVTAVLGPAARLEAIAYDESAKRIT